MTGEVGKALMSMLVMHQLMADLRMYLCLSQSSLLPLLDGNLMRQETPALFKNLACNDSMITAQQQSQCRIALPERRHCCKA